MKLKHQPEDLIAEILDKVIESSDDPAEATRAMARMGLLFLMGQFEKSYHSELKKIITSIESE